MRLGAGRIHRRSIHWHPEERLSFRMEGTELPFGAHVREMADTIEIEPEPGGVRVTRTTSILAGERGGFLRRTLLHSGLERVHLYVLRNWRRLAERDTAPSPR